MQRDALPPEAILYAMLQTADTVIEAYGRALQRKDTTNMFLAESELPASKDKIKAALVFRAFFHKSQAQLDKRMYDLMYSHHQTVYGYLANFVSEEIAARSRKEAELMGGVPEIQRKGQIDPKWLEEFRRYLTPPEEIGRYGKEFDRLCDEFARRLAALDDPFKRAKELALLQRALLSD